MYSWACYLQVVDYDGLFLRVHRQCARDPADPAAAAVRLCRSAAHSEGRVPPAADRQRAAAAAAAAAANELAGAVAGHRHSGSYTHMHPLFSITANKTRSRYYVAITSVDAEGPNGYMLKRSVSMTSHAYLLVIEGLCTQGWRPGWTVGESVGGIPKVDSSDRSNGLDDMSSIPDPTLSLS